jgi:hypothetical protein
MEELIAVRAINNPISPIAAIPPTTYQTNAIGMSSISFFMLLSPNQFMR